MNNNGSAIIGVNVAKRLKKSINGTKLQEKIMLTI